MELTSDVHGFNLCSLYVKCQNGGDMQTAAHLEDKLNNVIFECICEVIQILWVNNTEHSGSNKQ